MKSQIVRFRQAAEELSASLPTVHKYVKQGLLVLAKFPGFDRARGVTRDSLDKLIAETTGKAQSTGGAQ